MNRRQARRVRLDFLDLLRIQFAQAQQTIGIAAFPQSVQAVHLFVGRGDDHLAALLMLDAVRAAEGQHLLQALHGALRLDRAGLVVQARMQHAAVVARLVGGELGLFFHQQYF